VSVVAAALACRDTQGIEEESELAHAPGFGALYLAHFPRLVRALELTGLDRARAEDVAQEAFARTLGHWRRVRNGTNPAGYVFRTAFRLARRRFDDLALTEDLPGRSDVALDAALHVDLERGLAAMPPRRRACALLCLGVGISPKEAARSLGIAEGTVRKQLELARADLRIALGEPPETDA
jgi:RNA polymerase sigma factor (sigma-70 family)